MRKILRIKVGQMTEEDREQGIGSRCQSVLTPLRQGCVEVGVPQPSRRLARGQFGFERLLKSAFIVAASKSTMRMLKLMFNKCIP